MNLFVKDPDPWTKNVKIRVRKKVKARVGPLNTTDPTKGGTNTATIQ